MSAPRKAAGGRLGHWHFPPDWRGYYMGFALDVRPDGRRFVQFLGVGMTPETARSQAGGRPCCSMHLGVDDPATPLVRWLRTHGVDINDANDVAAYYGRFLFGEKTIW